MNRFTVQKIRQNYLFKQINWFEKQIEYLTQNESSLTSVLQQHDSFRIDVRSSAFASYLNKLNL